MKNVVCPWNHNEECGVQLDSCEFTSTASFPLLEHFSSTVNGYDRSASSFSLFLLLIVVALSKRRISMHCKHFLKFTGLRETNGTKDVILRIHFDSVFPSYQNIFHRRWTDMIVVLLHLFSMFYFWSWQLIHKEEHIHVVTNIFFKIYIIFTASHSKRKKQTIMF